MPSVLKVLALQQRLLASWDKTFVCSPPNLAQRALKHLHPPPDPAPEILAVTSSTAPHCYKSFVPPYSPLSRSFGRHITTSHPLLSSHSQAWISVQEKGFVSFSFSWRHFHPFWMQGVRCRRYSGLQLFISASTERNKVFIFQVDDFLQRSLCFISWPSCWHNMNTEPLFAFWSGQVHSQHLPGGYTIFPFSPPKCLCQLYWFWSYKTNLLSMCPHLRHFLHPVTSGEKNTTRITFSIIFICSPPLARKKENQ